LLSTHLLLLSSIYQCVYLYILNILILLYINLWSTAMLTQNCVGSEIMTQTCIFTLNSKTKDSTILVAVILPPSLGLLLLLEIHHSFPEAILTTLA